MQLHKGETFALGVHEEEQFFLPGLGWGGRGRKGQACSLSPTLLPRRVRKFKGRVPRLRSSTVRSSALPDDSPPEVLLVGWH